MEPISNSIPRGHPLKRLSVLDKLVITLGYYREYRMMWHIAFDYGASKSMVHKSIQWVENALIQSGEFALPSKRKLLETQDVKVALVDATECEIERPKKTKRLLFRQEETYDKGPGRCRCFDTGRFMHFDRQRQPA